MRPGRLVIALSILALLSGLGVIVYTIDQDTQTIGSRKAAPGFSLRNRFYPYILQFKEHLKSTAEFSSILIELERENAGAWLMSMENGEKRFISPYLDLHERLKTLLLIETGNSGVKKAASKEFFGGTVLIGESVDYGNFFLDYIPSYSLIMESDYNKILQDGYTLNRVYVSSFSLGRFVSDVFSGMGPVIVLKEGSAVPEKLFEITERYSISFMPVRYFLKRA